MDAKMRKRRDFLQNITIVLLSLSAVFLIAQTQLYTLGVNAGSSYLRYLTGTPDQMPDAAQANLTSLAAPVRIAVTGVYGGRYGSVTLTTAGESFEPIGGLLREALGTIQDFAPCDSQEFFNALGSTSIYCDFLGALPLPVLAELVGASSDSGLYARRVVISAQGGGGAMLYLWDGADSCQRGTSVIPLEDLNNVVGSYELNGALFALDNPSPDAAEVAPCSLFPLELPNLPVLAVSAAIPDYDALLAALSFYPRTNSRYTESGGVEVITDGDRTLRLIPDGAVRYRSGGDPAVAIASAGETPTPQEAVMGAVTLLNSLLPAQSGGAGLYPQSVRQTEITTTVTFGWQVGGVPIRFDHGGSAAEVTLSGNIVSSLFLRFRQYSSTEESSLLMPLRQALAIAARQGGKELSIGYVDDGTAAAAAWLAD